MDLTTNSGVVRLLKQGGWFGSLPAELQTLILERAVVRSYQRGQFIVQEGVPARGLFAVLEGTVRVVRQVGDADEVLLHIGEKGLWFGEYGLLTGALSIGSIIADSPAQALMLSIADFERIVDAEPRYYRHFANLALERYAYLYRYVAEGHGLGAEDWLCTRLADLAEMRRRDNPMELPVSLTVSQGDLATMIGISRQTLNALLARLQTHGLIEVGFRSIRILDEARLREGCRSATNGDSPVQRISHRC